MGLAVALAAVTEIPIMLLSGRIIEAIGLRGMFALGALDYAVAFALLSPPRLRSPSCWSSPLNGIGFASLYVGMVVIVDTLVTPSLRAIGQGLRQTVTFGLAPVLGAAGGGWPDRGSGTGTAARSRGVHRPSSVPAGSPTPRSGRR